MIAFLTSSPGGFLFEEGGIVPCRLDERNGFIDNLKRYWKERSKCLVICASPVDFEGNDNMRNIIMEAFALSGLEMTACDICDGRDSDFSEKRLEGYDVLILGGGHVPTQNRFMKQIGLREKIKDFAGIIIGISAGTMNCADTVYAQPELEGESLDSGYDRFLIGLGVTDKMILPHYEEVKDAILDGRRVMEDITYPDSMGREFYALLDGSYLLVTEGENVVYGEAYLVKDGAIKEICQETEKVSLKYLAHISEDKQREQSVKEHLEGTARLAKEFAAEFGYGDWGYCCGMLHDIGKYSEKFQQRIRGGKEKVDHATAGAQLCRKLGKEKGGFYVALAYCIAGHHAGLPDTGGSADTGEQGTFEGRMKKKIEDYQAYEEEVEIPPLETPFFLMKDKKDPSFTMSFLIRMLYSCLVDADYLDTEEFMKDGETGREKGDDISTLWEKLNSHIASWLANEDEDTINGRRTEILKYCIEKGREKKGLFRLTVPTGGGKTVASLAFALNHAAKHDMKRIIYVIPYTSIIEQNAKVFSDILGKENVLEHHSNIDYGSSEELMPKQLAAENWDLPVIVTTNVQFFESLFSNKSSKCRKLHNIANSVIIFDEAQMLPNDYLKPCIAGIEELIKHYRSSVVLCTATQPSLKQFFSSDLQYLELCPRMDEQFQFFKRSFIKNLEKISEEELLDRMKIENQALCILNTKKSVQKIYEDLKGEGVYHLSTFMYPQHRKERLSVIRERLKSGMKCIVIATSLVEAGVDLDFQTVYRQLAGVDSMIQAAGRCNREGKRNVSQSFTYIFQLEESQKVPSQEQQIDTAKQVIRKYEDISSLEAIQEYFARLYGFKGSALDKKNILEEFRKGRFAFAKAGKEFKLIEQDTKTVLIPRDERGKRLAEELRFKGATKALIREAAQYCVNIYDNLFQKMYGAGMLVQVSEELKGEFFVLRDCEDYSEETGLRVDIELGNDIWF